MSPSSRAAAPALRMTRSLLFVPGDRPERFDKALASGAHAVVLDLEDAVAPAAKVGARGAVAAWLAGGKRAVVRINGADTPWFADDVAAVTAAGAAALMLPKAEPASLAAAAAASKLPLIALVETVAGVLGLRELARAPGVVRLAFGSIDFSAESGIADEADALTAVRNQIVLESCHASPTAAHRRRKCRTGQRRTDAATRLAFAAARFWGQAVHPPASGSAGERGVSAFAARTGLGATCARGLRVERRRGDGGGRQDGRSARDAACTPPSPADASP